MATTITPTIVTINATLTVAPTPSQLQQSGAIISVGGTTLAINSYQFISQLSNLTSLLSASGNFTELTNMATTFFAQGTAVGFYVLELGVQTTPDAAISTLETWINANPGIFYIYLAPANWDSTKDEIGAVQITNGGSGYIIAPTVTFSAPISGITATGTALIQNGEVISVTITNPGSGYTAPATVTFSAPTSGTTATGTTTLANAFNILGNNFASPNSKTYFVGTTTSATIGNYTTPKSLILWADSPVAPSTEFSAAGIFYDVLVNNPSAVNKLAPMGYRYLYGITAWPATGYTAKIQTILSAYGNLAITGAEGDISNVCLFKGTSMDGSQISWWYGVDWVLIQIKQALAAAIINGSNSNPPLEYNQHGINTLAAVATGINNNAVTFGCILLASLTSTAFFTYSQQNPNNYKAGIYNGFSDSITGINGFLTMTFNIDAIQFVS